MGVRSNFKELTCFRPLFEPGNGDYLSLLSLDAKLGAHSAIDLLRSLLTSVPGAHTQIAILFGDRNWREHLVGCVAALLSGTDETLLALIWAAADDGSWVGPQLAVTLALLDPSFKERARSRIEAPGCAPTLLSALLEMYRRVIGDDAWVNGQRMAPQVARLLEDDVDGGARMASFWLDRLSELGVR
jgi:hypothetical protein